MEKIKKLLVLLPLLFLLTGCSVPFIGQNQQNEGGKQQEQQGKNEQKNLSLRNVFGRGDAYKCSYQIQDAEVTVYAKGQKMRVEGMSLDNNGQGSGGMINDGEWIYIWNDENKEGMKYNLKTLEELNQEVESEEVENYQNPEEWAKQVEAEYEVKCEPTAISDSRFNPPENVEFKDLTEMLQKAQDLQQTIPSPNSQGQMPEGVDQEDMDQKMDELQDIIKDFNQE